MLPHKRLHRWWVVVPILWLEGIRIYVVNNCRFWIWRCKTKFLNINFCPSPREIALKGLDRALNSSNPFQNRARIPRQRYFIIGLLEPNELCADTWCTQAWTWTYGRKRKRDQSDDDDDEKQTKLNRSRCRISFCGYEILCCKVCWTKSIQFFFPNDNHATADLIASSISPALAIENVLRTNLPSSTSLLSFGCIFDPHTDLLEE